ncbi:MAG: PQQ-binding-like beta-propeller repeat protein, partial [Gemmatimonadaceae bacterium]|nr:PQQ-binding-like beta-propeller repeat protein [Chitinophagaceae bacterium]
MTGLVFLFLVCNACHSKNKYDQWSQYKGSDDNIQYSSLTEIDTSNVSTLAIAWEYHTGDADTISHSQIQCNPIIVNGLLFGTSPKMKLFAIDAETGAEKWQFNPFDSIYNSGKLSSLNSCRGVTYWSDGNNDGRLFYTAGSYLWCISSETGKPINAFGDGGKIDLHVGLGDDVKDQFVTATSPGTIYKDLIVMGSRVNEGHQAAPGHIRAFDVRTGKMKWIFRTIPQPGETGYESWK